MRKLYHGVIPPIITPIDSRECVNEDGFRALIERCIEGGLHGVFVAGTNGECMQLKQRQRDNAIRIAIDQTRGRVPVVCGVMDTSTARVIDNILAARDMGATCCVVTSIFYARHTSQDESIRHFERICDETDTDIIIYNMPSMTGLAFAPETVIKLAGLERVVGYKDSSPAYGGFLRVLAALGHTLFACLQGVTAHAISSLLMGADGFVPVLAPLFPELFRDAYEAGVSGDVHKARRYDELLRESSLILNMSKNMTAAAKFAISTLGLTDKRVIWPQDGVTPDEEIKIIKQIERVNELYALEKGLGA